MVIGNVSTNKSIALGQIGFGMPNKEIVVFLLRNPRLEEMQWRISASGQAWKGPLGGKSQENCG